MSETRKVLEECKESLAEIRRLVNFIRSMPPEEFLERVKSLPIKDNAVLLDMIRLGELSRQVTSVRGRRPTYIL